ncbi:MAG: hypothetical protein NTX53_05480 [candidate division WOR-3 bacterium]|nr:hypothetical protein [candidate division WOR-3 bacterium]
MAAGCRTVADAVAWANSVIAAVDKPDMSVTEIAMGSCCDRVDIIKLLQDVPGDSNPRAVIRRVLADFYGFIIAHPERKPWIAAYLARMADEGQLPEGFDVSLGCHRAALDLADEGLANRDRVLEELTCCLARYADPHGARPHTGEN